MKGNEPGYAVSLTDFLRILWRRLWIIVLAALLFAAAAAGVSLTQTPRYEATTTILVSQSPSQDSTSLGSDVAGVQSLVQTVVEAVSSRPIAASVVDNLGLQVEPQALLENTSVEAVPDTQFIEVVYTDTDPARAEQVANSIGQVSSNQVSEVSGGVITAEVWEPAVQPTSPASPTPILNGLLALGLGLMFGVGLAILLEFMDDSWRSAEEVEEISGVPTFGIIPEFGASSGRKTSKVSKRSGS
ncbi:YveK family protein [Rubrobacter aplysinae]|uniref:YveK family protein n=1 Tax=Rubrobacter aplysinae TaxID=909625 RepID=UPI00064C3442|nr:Wzz/FepE/Etk N-terminal domain-containing protein [Rubrobacter aplysinae]